MANRNEHIQNRCSARDRLILNEYQVMTSELVKYFAGLDTNMLVLDAGCGDGFFLEILRNLGFKSIYGIDTIASSLNIARNKGLRVIEGSIYDLDLRDKLDVVLLCNNLEYIENPGMAIARACDALKEDGILYLITTVYDYGKSRRWFRRKKIERVEEIGESHQRVFSMSSLLWLLESHQFKIEPTFKQPNISKGKQSGLVSIVARKKKSTKSAVTTPKSTPSERKLEPEKTDEQEKTDAPFFQTEHAEDKDEELTEKTVLESEDEHGDDTV